jgi:LuxR family maltose regulon positive regulatory protein
MFVEALSYHLDDQPAEADERLAHTVERARQLSLPPAVAMALGERTILAIERRDWTAAADLAGEGVTLVEELHLGGYLQAIVVYATAARVAAHRGEVVTAKHYAALASRLRPVCTTAVPLSAHFLLQLAHAYLELADPAGARTVLRQVRDILRLRPDLGTVARRADELEQMLDTIRVGAVGASSLTAAELRLLPLLATHLSYRDIGERLFLSRNTVKSEAVSLFRKLGVSSRGDAVTKAEEIGLFGR